MQFFRILMYLIVTLSIHECFAMHHTLPEEYSAYEDYLADSIEALKNIIPKAKMTVAQQARVDDQLWRGISDHSLNQVQQALRRGADVNATRRKVTPFMFAYSLDQVDIVRALLHHDQSIDINYNNINRKMTALDYVLSSFLTNQEQTIITELIRSGVDIYKKNYSGQSYYDTMLRINPGFAQEMKDLYEECHPDDTLGCGLK